MTKSEQVERDLVSALTSVGIKYPEALDIVAALRAFIIDVIESAIVGDDE